MGIGSQARRPLAALVDVGRLVGPIDLRLVAPALGMMFPAGDDHHRLDKAEHEEPSAPDRMRV